MVSRNSLSLPPRRRSRRHSISDDHLPASPRMAIATSGKSNDQMMAMISSAGRDAFAGAMSGAFARTVTAPIERVKLILQLQGSNNSTNNANNKTSAKPTTAWSVARHIYQTEGILAFWRGNLQNVIRAAGQAALNFALMDQYKQFALSLAGRNAKTTQQQQRRSNFIVSFVAGGLAGGTVTTVLYPTEFLRTRLALDLGHSGRQYRGMWDVATQIFRSDGIRGVYKGYGISLVGSVVYRLLYLGGYDAMKNEWQFWQAQPGSGASMKWTERMFLAQFVSLSAGTICYPIDSVRRRMMMQAGKPLQEQLYHNSLQCFQHVWKSEGARGFFLGFGPNVFRSIGGALALVAYDGFKAMLASN
ncbi:mitochondrial carrier protein [Nitzschia inconspicua]|uniref:ADP/ATP translocase n=1 Tax=Nitzschia inconspicua TaxID=303405 RepID=A0A9K3LY64_9STRA|nr:mitochondrial carrier protein [Nitzschia inconspicua]